MFRSIAATPQIPAMAKNKDGGSIIVNSSVMSLRAQTTFNTAGVYAASKANVDMLVRYGAIEVRNQSFVDALLALFSGKISSCA